MKNTYFNLVEQSFYFPQDGFDLRNEYLTFHGISLKYLIEKYGTPFNVIYLPKVGDQIKKARNLFNRAIKNNNYEGSYKFAYCTKCNHFSHVLQQVLKHKTDLETSSAFDVDLILNLYHSGHLNKNITILHNGYKTDEYLDKIVDLREAGFKNCIVILDGKDELERLNIRLKKGKIKVGVRMAINEEPQSAYYTSRLGIPASEIVDFYEKHIKPNDKIELTLFHFFVDSGIKDTLYYWGEFKRALKSYIELRKVCDSLIYFDLGGGFPIRNHLGFSYDYEYMINEIVLNIKEGCLNDKVPMPDIFSEFGKYTIGESSAIIFKVLEQKKQNDAELWYIIDNSLMNTIPDSWSINEKFILLPVNKWNNEYTRVNIGGISCDHSDYYNSEDLNQEVLLPEFSKEEKEPLYIGFFHTGAYQNSISGYGGIKHCLIPSPKHIIIDVDEAGNFYDYIYRTEQTVEDMFNILGYNSISSEVK